MAYKLYLRVEERAFRRLELQAGFLGAFERSTQIFKMQLEISRVRRGVVDIRFQRFTDQLLVRLVRYARVGRGQRNIR